MTAPGGLDPTDPVFRANPYPFYAKLREEKPIFRSPAGFWLLTRYRECHKVLSDDRFGYPESADGFFVAGFDKQRNFLIFMNPPDHTRMRRIVREGLSPKVVHALKPFVQASVDRLLDEAGTDFDLIAQFSHPLPFGTICELLAVPDGDRALIMKLAQDYLAGIGAEFAITPEKAKARDDALETMNEFFAEQAAERRARPGSDILTHLVGAKDAGEMTDDELFGTCVLLFVAGHGTTTHLVANAALALMENRDQLDRFMNEPDLETSAVEELLRYGVSTMQSFRVALEDVQLDADTLIRAGEQVLIVRGSANRDPEVFADPDRLDLGRTDNRHLSFATGSHICLGSALARMQTRVAVRTLFERSPTLKPTTSEFEYLPTLMQRGLVRLPVTVS